MSINTDFKLSVPLASISGSHGYCSKKEPRNPANAVAKQTITTARSPHSSSVKATSKQALCNGLLKITAIVGVALLGVYYWRAQAPSPEAPFLAHKFKTTTALIEQNPADPASIKDICPLIFPAVISANKENPTTLEKMFDITSQKISNEVKSRFFSVFSNCLIEAKSEEVSLLVDALAEMTIADRDAAIGTWINQKSIGSSRFETMVEHMQSRGFHQDIIFNMTQQIPNEDDRYFSLKKLMPHLLTAESIMKACRQLGPSYAYVIGLLEDTNPPLPSAEVRQLLVSIYESRCLEGEYFDNQFVRLTTKLVENLSLQDAFGCFQDLAKIMSHPVTAEEKTHGDGILTRLADYLLRVHPEGKGQSSLADRLIEYLPHQSARLRAHVT